MEDKLIIPPSFRRQVKLCWLALLCESLVASFWRAAIVFMLTLSIFLFDILPGLGFVAHGLVLLAAGSLFGYFLVHGFARFKHPRRQDVLARLEQSNGLSHQPLQGLEDDLLAGARDQTSQALWQLHQLKMNEATKSVRAGAPAPILTGADPYALRMLAGVILLVSVAVAGGDAGNRVWASLIPDVSGPVDYDKIKLSAWITPPVYTNMAPVFLPYDATAPDVSTPPLIDVPTGSMLVVQLSGLTHTPELLDGNGVSMAFESDGVNSFSYQQEITADDTLSVMIKNKSLAQWTLYVRPDLPPQITFNGSPTETVRKTLHAVYKAYDDYGVEEIRLRLRRPPAAGEKASGELYEYPVIIPGNKREFIEADFLKDLTPHPWAGTQVLLELIATDAVDNETVSMSQLVILPQRVFNHPVAREIIKLRTRLALNPVVGRRKVALLLSDVGDHPANYDHDIAVHLGLRAAVLRLVYPKGESETDAVIQLLWELALRLEDGGLSLAEARLRAAQNAVMEALARGASAQELSRLMDELEMAMADYMQELVENMLREDTPPPEPAADGQELSPQDLKAMLDRIRDLMQMGMKDAAQRLLAEMQQMMENMQAGMPQQSTPQGMEALEMMQGLKDIMQGQRELLEKSYRDMQQRQDNMPAGENQANNGGSSGEQSSDGMQASDAMIQQKLREELGDLMQRYQDLMDKRPPSLNRADKAMGRAEKALGKGNAARAVQAEGQALDQLQSAARTMQEQLLERFSGEGALGQQLLGESGEGGRDPLGRKAGTDPRNSPEGVTGIPAESDFQRVRSIRDELRRRSGQRHRPEEEIEYIDRLLQPF